MGDDLGAYEDDGSFMEASPIDRGAPGDEDDVGNTYTAGQETSLGVLQFLLNMLPNHACSVQYLQEALLAHAGTLKKI